MTHEEKLKRLFDTLHSEGFPYATGYLEQLVRAYVPEKYIDWHLKERTNDHAPSRRHRGHDRRGPDL